MSDDPLVIRRGVMFEPYLTRWNLTPDGAPIVTRSGRLLPVRRHGAPAMLKIAVEAEEKWGGALMVWWDGDGAARVLEHEGDALLLERAVGGASLAEMAQSGRDDEASRILCSVAARLHAPRSQPLPDLIPLTRWFQGLERAASQHGGVLTRSFATARALLSSPQEVCILHGDLHHANVLDFGPRGWLAIDPKRLVGERGFDFANIFCNPDHDVARTPGRLERQASVVSEAAGLDRRRLLEWILAWAGLSAAWLLEDGMEAEFRDKLEIAEVAEAELTKAGRRGRTA